MARDSLREWQDKNHPWLELTDIHRETTENIRVTVMPFFIGSRVLFYHHVFIDTGFASLFIVYECNNASNNVVSVICLRISLFNFTGNSYGISYLLIQYEISYLITY